MIKSKQKIFRFSAYLVLIGYLTIVISNVFHHHHFNFGEKDSSLYSENHISKNHLVLNGSEIFCPIYFAYNSVNNSTASFDSSVLENEKNPEYFKSSFVSSKPTKECIDHYNLRAPPALFFS